MAQSEPDSVKSALFGNLSRAADAQAEIWKDKIHQSGVTPPVGYVPSFGGDPDPPAAASLCGDQALGAQRWSKRVPGVRLIRRTLLASLGRGTLTLRYATTFSAG